MADDAASGSRPEAPSRYDDLLKAATELFSQLGYERTTVRLIAERLGIQSGSLYSHISGKEQILQAIVRAVGDDFVARATKAREEAGDPLTALRGMCHAHLAVLDQHLDAVTVYYNEWRRLDEENQAEIAAVRAQYEQLFRETLKAGIADGTFADVDVRSAVLVVLSTLNWTYQWYQVGGALTPSEIADRYLDVFLRGLLRRND